MNARVYTVSISPRRNIAEFKSFPDNFAVSRDPPANLDPNNITPEEKHAMETRGAAFGLTGNAYARMHGTRPSTIGFALASSPLAQLAW